jgi:hypothetical protein
LQTMRDLSLMVLLALISSPNETIVRSVKVIMIRFTVVVIWNLVIGIVKRWLVKIQFLSKAIKSKLLDDEQFWNIINYDGWIVFSLFRPNLHLWKKQSFKIIAPSAPIIKSLVTGNSIYYQVSNQGLYEIEGGESKLVSAHPVLKLIML